MAAAGGKGYLSPFSRRSPETEDAHKGPRDDVQRKRAGASRQRSRERRCASHPLTTVPAPPRGKMCDTGHDDPGLKPADPLRRHTEQQKNRGRRAPNAHRAEDFFLGAPGVRVISKPVCGKVSPHEP